MFYFKKSTKWILCYLFLFTSFALKAETLYPQSGDYYPAPEELTCNSRIVSIENQSRVIISKFPPPGYFCHNPGPRELRPYDRNGHENQSFFVSIEPYAIDGSRNYYTYIETLAEGVIETGHVLRIYNNSGALLSEEFVAESLQFIESD